MYLKALLHVENHHEERHERKLCYDQHQLSNLAQKYVSWRVTAVCVRGRPAIFETEVVGT